MLWDTHISLSTSSRLTSTGSASRPFNNFSYAFSQLFVALRARPSLLVVHLCKTGNWCCCTYPLLLRSLPAFVRDLYVRIDTPFSLIGPEG